MSGENSPQFVTSDDETESHKRKLETAPSTQHPEFKQMTSSIETVQDGPKKTRHIAKRPRLPPGFSLVSYEDDRNDDDEDEADNEDDERESDNAGTDHSTRQSNHSHGHTTSSDEDGENASNIQFIITDGPLTVLSSEHKLSDFQALKEVRETVHSPVSNAAPPSTTGTLDTGPTATTSEEAVPTTTQPEKLSELEVQLPPEPPGLCDEVLQQKVDSIIQRMRLDITYDPNMKIQDNKHFRNPSMYEKLISFLKIDEKGTNFPPEIYNPYRWNSLSFYDELAKIQNREVERLEKLRKEQRKNDAAGLPAATTASALSNPSLTRAASGPNLSGSVPLVNSTDAMNSLVDGSVASGFAEPRKRSKWDTAPPVEAQPASTTDTTTIPRTASDMSKICIPAVGSLVRKK
uniref:SAP30-binding protein n=1 Tax=Schistocephalus solidus TaxID=70667 RepID=A0A0X3NFE3_SCHSO